MLDGGYVEGCMYGNFLCMRVGLYAGMCCRSIEITETWGGWSWLGKMQPRGLTTSFSLLGNASCSLNILLGDIDTILTDTINNIPHVHENDPDTQTLAMAAENSVEVGELQKQVSPVFREGLFSFSLLFLEGSPVPLSAGGGRRFALSVIGAQSPMLDRTVMGHDPFFLHQGEFAQGRRTHALVGHKPVGDWYSVLHPFRQCGCTAKQPNPSLPRNPVPDHTTYTRLYSTPAVGTATRMGPQAAAIAPMAKGRQGIPLAQAIGTRRWQQSLCLDHFTNLLPVAVPQCLPEEGRCSSYHVIHSELPVGCVA